MCSVFALHACLHSIQIGVVSWASAVRCEVQLRVAEKMESVPLRRVNALARFCIPCLR